MEETGFDVSKLLNKDEYLEVIFGQQRVRLYIIAGVKDDIHHLPHKPKRRSVYVILLMYLFWSHVTLKIGFVFILHCLVLELFNYYSIRDKNAEFGLLYLYRKLHGNGLMTFNLQVMK